MVTVSDLPRGQIGATRRLTRLPVPVVGVEPGLHAVHVPIGDNEDDVLGPHRILCGIVAGINLVL